MNDGYGGPSENLTKLLKPQVKQSKAAEGLEFIPKLYLIDIDPEERHKERLLRSKLVLEAFSAGLKKSISFVSSKVI